MWKFIRFEWNYWLRTPMTWIFLFIISMLVMGAVSSENVTIGGGVGSVHKNAPYVVEMYYAILSLMGLLMTTAFMTSTAIRDYAHGMDALIFSSPVKKRDYYFGKFIGAFTICIIPLLGVSIGCLIGPWMPWTEPERVGHVIWSGHVLGILTFAIPNTFIAGVFLYMLANAFKNNIVSFVGAMLILVLYVISSNYTNDLAKEWLANLIDPFGIRPESIISKYMTVDEKNTHGVMLTGALLVNRLVWVGISMVVLILAYIRFSFTRKNEKAGMISLESEEFNELTQVSFSPTQRQISFSAILGLIWFELKAIIKHPTFIIILIIGIINLITDLASRTGYLGISLYPVTYNVIDMIRGSFYLFLIAIITFYSGVLVWKDRDAKFDEIQDAARISSAALFSSKVIAMVVAIALVQLLCILVGVITQSGYGYHRYQWSVYFESLMGIDLLGFIFLTVLSLLLHYLINNRYIAYFAFIAFVLLNSFLWNALNINTYLVKFGSMPNAIYSDMNGFGPFVPSVFWYGLYWTFFAIMLLLFTYAYYIRGKENRFSDRTIFAKINLRKVMLPFMIALSLFVSSGSFIYYNTEVLNVYDTEKSQELKQVDYEKMYKKYEHLIQPRFIRFQYDLDILPSSRSLKVKIHAWVKNKSAKPITELHFSMPEIFDSMQLTIPMSKLKLNDKRLKYRIYNLNSPLLPEDSLLILMEASRMTKGFENEVSFTQLTHNGTFFNNMDITPIIGYDINKEISSKNRRIKYKLPKRDRMPRLNDQDMIARSNSYFINDADLVDVSTTISTSSDQIAVAPGSLINEWEKGGRKFFSYRLDHPSINFYSFISARYIVERKKWHGIDMEVYYTKEHAYNVPNMMKSIEKSLDYYTTHFGPYYHKQCRIIEFPRYSTFAQAFPGTMPYSESIGFIMDLRNVTKDDIDMVFYVVAHEMGHQYWAYQLIGAQMQGSEMMSEGFAQYSALMVMEKEYGRDKMKKFLKYEMDQYLRNRGTEDMAERPLISNEHQAYIYYHKASVVLYYLKEMIGEHRMNDALRNLLDSFAYKFPPYPSANVALRAFQRVTPDSLQYLLKDLFESIILFSNRTMDVTCKKQGKDYVVDFHTKSEKYKADSLGKEQEVPLADYIDIGVFGRSENGNKLGKPLVLKRIKLIKKENSFSFKTKEIPYFVGIDPYNYLIDRIPEDNIKKVEISNP